METAVIVALIGIGGAIIGVGGTLLGQFLANNRADRREKRRLDYDREQADKQRSHELDMKRQEQLRQERLSAYTELAELTKTIDPTEPYTFMDMAAPMSRIELVASNPAVVESARTLYGEAYWTRKKAREIYEDEDRDPAADEGFQEMFNSKEARREEFLEQAKRDLTQ